jgi:ribosomal protein L11 methyltransferase
MVLWQKQASARWLSAHESRLEEIAGTNLAIISRPGRARSVVQVICSGKKQSRKLLRDFGGVAQPLPRNWWKITQARGTHPLIRIGRRLEIVSEPSSASEANEKAQIVIPAAGAFGTGEHATTAMSLRLLEETTRAFPRGWRSLDAGTGTGILALAARKLGAGEVIGLDNDPRAVAHARQNARLNHISRAKFVAVDLLHWKPIGRYDLITANLFSEVLIAALPMFRRALRADGGLIVSGILREQNEAVSHALLGAGFQLEKQRRRGKWVALLCRKCAWQAKSARGERLFAG